MSPRISGKLSSTNDKFHIFIDKVFRNQSLFKMARTNSVKAMEAEGLDAAESPLKPVELQALLESIDSIRAAALREGNKLSPIQIFEAIFPFKEIGKMHPSFEYEFKVNIGVTIAGKQTGYNEGWSNSSSSTAVTTEGTHKIFPYESHSGPLVSPAERLVLAKKAGAIAKFIRTK